MSEVSETPWLRESKLILENVSRSYSSSNGTLTALENINLAVKEGEFLCIVGPSGCGKSTLLNLMAGLDRPTSGTIWADGHPMEVPHKGHILIFQELGLFPWLTVRENVEFGLRMQGIGEKERRNRARDYLRMVHLSRFENSYIHQLSGGMKQRVALARAFALEPDVLLMDEPFAALDAQTRDLLHEELERIWIETHKTIFFVTHNVREAVRLGDRVILLTFRPGRLKSGFFVDLPRPRHLEDPALIKTAREVLEQLRGEINKAVEAEYNRDEESI
ncbi:MAG: ABC transporter ATP-binding protein [Acidobacteria bacterium]|nr:ABC transporter ATP-binding protein [Acidobacteriota bacterium]